MFFNVILDTILILGEDTVFVLKFYATAFAYSLN